MATTQAVPRCEPVLPVNVVSAALVSGLLIVGTASATTGHSVEEGARLFRACAACHSIEPGRHRTGPSLAGIIGRKAGSANGFRRYSSALADSEITWNESTLDAWLRDPAELVPDNRMSFPGLPDEQARANLIAYLVQRTGRGAQPQPEQEGGMMGGMMQDAELPDLKALGPRNRVSGIRHCADTYEVSTADGAIEPFWEFNLRFKTDGSDRGPESGKPVIVGAGMMGDRAAVVFRSPKEISAFIQSGCPD